MLPRRYSALVVVLLLTQFSFSQNHITVECSGNRYFDSDYIQKFFSGAFRTSKDTTQLDSLIRRLRTIYQDNGFFKTEIRTNWEAGALHDTVLKLRITENDAAAIKKIVTDLPDSLLPETVRSALSEREGKTFSAVALENDIQQFLNYYQNHGFPFAMISVKNVVYIPEGNSVEVFLSFSKNGLFHIDRIDLTGKTETRADVVQRELKFERGQEYNQDWIDKIPTRLNRMKLFDMVGTPLFIVSPSGEGILQIPLQDRNNNSFDGVIGYMPSAKANEKGYITGFLDISFRNLFGSARAAAFRWKKINQLSSELEFSYLEPWVMNYPFNISLHFLQTKQDSTWVTWSIEPSVEYIASDEFSFSLDAGYSRVIPSIQTVPVFTVFNAIKSFLGFSFKYDTRDDPFVPRRGMLINNSYSVTSKRINGPVEYITEETKTKNKQQKAVMDLSLYLEPVKLNVVYLGLHGRVIEGDLIEVGDLFKFGGANTLRGYRENQFLGQRIAWSNIEYRVILEKRTYAFVFFDAGYFSQGPVLDKTQSSGTVTKNGYGIGLSFQTGLGIMNVSFAMANGVSFSQGVIHFGIKNEF